MFEKPNANSEERRMIKVISIKERGQTSRSLLAQKRVDSWVWTERCRMYVEDKSWRGKEIINEGGHQDVLTPPAG